MCGIFAAIAPKGHPACRLAVMLDAWREACLRPALCESCEG
jgi:hypothetical protein